MARDPGAERRRQMGALEARGPGPWAALGKVLERTDRAPLRFELLDEGGFYGALEVDGARVQHVETASGSADLIAYFVRQVEEITVLHSERATLRPHETARIEAKIDGARGDEQLDVEVDYPPR